MGCEGARLRLHHPPVQRPPQGHQIWRHVPGFGAEVLQQDRNLAEVWAPFARQALAEKGLLGEVEAEISSWSDVEN